MTQISSPSILWKCQSFEELSHVELYKILQLRNEVFVVEQNCPYQDCDEKDFNSFHLSGWLDTNILAYSRLIPFGISYPDAASIGRIVTSPTARKQELGKILMQNSLEKMNQLFGEIPIKIGAQTYLKKFYESFSFFSVGENYAYLEDGIPHMTMELKR